MKKIICEMAGSVLEIKVKVGQSVASGQEIAVVESMKMEVPVASTQAGKVAEVHKAVGDFVNAGEAIITLE